MVNDLDEYKQAIIKECAKEKKKLELKIGLMRFFVPKDKEIDIDNKLSKDLKLVRSKKDKPIIDDYRNYSRNWQNLESDSPKNKTFIKIQKKCKLKMNINGNIECSHRRMLLSGLDGCICREDNCFKNQPPKDK